MMSGSFFVQPRSDLSRPAIARSESCGNTPKSHRPLRYRSWKIDDLVERSTAPLMQAKTNGEKTGVKDAHLDHIDLTGFWRPRLKGWLGKHYHSLAGKALPAVVVARHHRVRKSTRKTDSAAGRRSFAVNLPKMQKTIRLKYSGKQHHSTDLVMSRSWTPAPKLEEISQRPSSMASYSECNRIPPAHQPQLPAYKGKGARPKCFGKPHHPLARKHRENKNVHHQTRPHT